MTKIGMRRERYRVRGGERERWRGREGWRYSQIELIDLTEKNRCYKVKQSLSKITWKSFTLRKVTHRYQFSCNSLLYVVLLLRFDVLFRFESSPADKIFVHV